MIDDDGTHEMVKGPIAFLPLLFFFGSDAPASVTPLGFAIFAAAFALAFAFGELPAELAFFFQLTFAFLGAMHSRTNGTETFGTRDQRNWVGGLHHPKSGSSNQRL